jgi:methylenetetrahydrofolate--tRNA-(uracil-5-)-methyltransferase
MTKTLHIIGAGLAGSEAAWQAANLGINVILHEMRPKKLTHAHQSGDCAELVCSNSFRSDDADHNAVGLLHEEMRKLNSIIMREGGKAAVPAGGALAVDRDIFSAGVTKALQEHPNITIEYGEVAGLPPEDWEHVIIATGPLTSDALAAEIAEPRAGRANGDKVGKWCAGGGGHRASGTGLAGDGFPRAGKITWVFYH